ncbi:MAG TPA: glycosyltransferase family 39 protein [Thermomicrobiales bacterium]|nr:glycosyltransferase family 39 protein [Thermomicrobiales bacterium]
MLDSPLNPSADRSLRAPTADPVQVAEPVETTHIRGMSVASTVLALSLGVGAVLRFWNINALGYNSDEAVYTGQAAALAGDPALSQFFPIFRAHPMVFQYLLSLVYSVAGVHDIIGRSLVALIGLATIFLVYRVGAELYGQWTGVIAATLMAVMPYHVVVTRQVLLDGPLTFCTTLTLLLLVRYANTGRALYLMGVGAALGLTFLTKETGFVLATAAFAFLALCPEIPVRIKPLILAGVCMMVPIFMFPVSIALAGRSDTARSYLVWQLLRRSNHTWDFFPTVVPPAIGWLVLAAAITGLFVLRSRRTWRETLLLSWIIIPTIVFQIWPVKGFQYLLPVAPAIAILAARTLTQWRPQWTHRFRTGLPWLNMAAIIVVTCSLLLPSWHDASDQQATSRMAGAGGIPGVRETGDWIQVNIPQDAVFVTIGPSMANLIQFYGHRKAYGLSVSTNPLHRNPSYEPLTNPDASLRYGDVQYMVWDSFTASRTEFFTNTFNKYKDKYHAKEIFSYSIPVNGPDGTKTNEPIIIIYEVTP